MIIRSERLVVARTTFSSSRFRIAIQNCGREKVQFCRDCQHLIGRVQGKKAAPHCNSRIVIGHISVVICQPYDQVG